MGFQQFKETLEADKATNNNCVAEALTCLVEQTRSPRKRKRTADECGESPSGRATDTDSSCSVDAEDVCNLSVVLAGEHIANALTGTAIGASQSTVNEEDSNSNPSPSKWQER